jgi:hypothetical protein
MPGSVLLAPHEDQEHMVAHLIPGGRARGHGQAGVHLPFTLDARPERKPLMPPFVQIVAYKTSKPAEMKAVADEWEKSTEGKRKTLRRVLCADRDIPGRYFNIVFFDSHEAAMENSALPETDQFSKRMMSFADGPTTFYNLDVVEIRE